MQLTVDKLEKSFGVQEVFKDVSFMIAKGEKVGLVGVNGSGKSTLVKCLLQPDYADCGTVSFEPGIRVGYVEQGFGLMPFFRACVAALWITGPSASGSLKGIPTSMKSIPRRCMVRITSPVLSSVGQPAQK